MFSGGSGTMNAEWERNRGRIWRASPPPQAVREQLPRYSDEMYAWGRFFRGVANCDPGEGLRVDLQGQNRHTVEMRISRYAAKLHIRVSIYRIDGTLYVTPKRTMRPIKMPPQAEVGEFRRYRVGHNWKTEAVSRGQ